MTEDDRTIIEARFHSLDAQNKTIIVLIADLRQHFDNEMRAMKNYLNTMANAARRVEASVKSDVRVVPSEVHHAYKKGTQP